MERASRESSAASSASHRPTAASAGGGEPIPSGTRAAFEAAYGYDFSRVRVHTDATAKKK